MNNALMFSSGNNGTGTPLDFYKALSREAGGFGCDVAADKILTLHRNWFGPDHDDPRRRDCLSRPWPKAKPNFMNPPYGEPEMPCKCTIHLVPPKFEINKGLAYKPVSLADEKIYDYSKCRKLRCQKRGWHTPIYIPGCIDFVRKAAEERRRGVTTYALLAARTDVEWFHEYIYDEDRERWRRGVQGRFLRGRLIFRRDGKPDPAPFPSMVVVFRP